VRQALAGVSAGPFPHDGDTPLSAEAAAAQVVAAQAATAAALARATEEHTAERTRLEDELAAARAAIRAAEDDVVRARADAQAALVQSRVWLLAVRPSCACCCQWGQRGELTQARGGSGGGGRDLWRCKPAGGGRSAGPGGATGAAPAALHVVRGPCLCRAHCWYGRRAQFPRPMDLADATPREWGGAHAAAMAVHLAIARPGDSAAALVTSVLQAMVTAVAVRAGALGAW
jgi:hypothetical protein